jgi:hypothetical protein
MHRPATKKFPVISVPPTPWDETVIAFEGDVLGGQTCMVKWPATAFLLLEANGAAIQVPTLTNLDALFHGDPLLETMGTFVANEVETEIIPMRNVMCVPPCYVPILLGQMLSPREAYTRLGGAIRANRFEGDCAPLLAYL